MAFSFANVASSAAPIGDSSQQGVHVQDGQELKEIQTGKLGFKTINGETKVKLLPSPWSLEDPPVPTSQLLSVASSQGVVAAAGPDVLIIASTDTIRDVLSAKEGDNVRDLTPILAIPHNRLTHVAFSSDESILVVCGPGTNGLVAYQVEKLKAGQADVALQIQSRTTFRALVPNPNPQQAYLFAAVDIDGKLTIADFSKGQFVGGSGNSALLDGVACVSWSNRGKQLVAGLASGNAIQLKPDGNIVTHIPKSTSIPDEMHIAAVAWLEDDTFLFIYTPTSVSTENGIPPSEYYIVERSNKTTFTFHHLPEILPPFGVERLPTYHFIARLRKFDPHISDLLFLSATTATDVGMISKSTEPLAPGDNPEDLVANEFTFTTLEDDTRRAALPLSGADDTSPIGMAVDLSSRESVINPLPSDPEIEESSGPVPNLLVLNHEGLLCSWWVIYSDSIQQKTTFSGFDGLKTTEQVRSAVSPPAESESTAQPASAISFNQTSSTTASPFAQPVTANMSSPFTAPAGQSAFSAATPQPSSQPTFGSGTSFGATSKIGENKSSWTSTGFAANSGTAASGFSTASAFGQPAFGTPSAISSNNTPAFGSAAPFGQNSTPSFGKTGFGTTAASPFGNTGASTTASGFASFANSGGFRSGTEKKDADTSSPFAKPSNGTGFASFASSGGFRAASNKEGENTESPFAKPAAGGGFGGFGKVGTFESPFAKTGTTSTFGTGQGFGGIDNASNNTNKGTFGGVKPFQVGSSFKGDGTARHDLPAPSGGKGFGFAAGFGALLDENKKSISPTQNKEAEMDDDEDEDEDSASTPENERPFAAFSPEQKINPSKPGTQFTTPPSTITQPKTTPAPPVSGLFANQQQSTTPQSGPVSFQFASTTPKETPAASRTMFGTKPIASTTPAAVQTSEPVKSFDAIDNVPAPAPKAFDPVKDDNTSKIKTEPLSDNENVDLKSIPEAPLPPDPVSKPGYTTGDTSASSAASKTSKEHDDAPLPPDFVPANKSASKEAQDAQLPEDEDEDELAEDEDEGISSDFEDSGEDVTQEFSPAEEGEDDQDDEATTEHIQTSPESSFKGGDTTSPTGGLFAKVSGHDSLKPPRPLFGEVSRSAPIFPPPKPQQSPRSPSPVRPFVHNDTLRSDSRSVSAPLRPGSAIQQRKTDYMQSNIAAQATKAREEETHRERARLEAKKSAAKQAKADEFQVLEDDEDDRIQKELASPVQPSENLDEFMTYQASTHAETSKVDIPAQIERLYQDINSMIYTTGINARSLTAFIMYQQNKVQVRDWPQVLQSGSPITTLHEEWSLNDTYRLHEGTTALASTLEQNQVRDVTQKLEDCQTLLTKDLFELRTKITTIRKSLHARANGSSAVAPLSAEQASIQHDLRKASALVQTKLIQCEDILAVMRARLAEVSTQTDNANAVGTSSNYVQKKPTVEAVTNTIAKMTSMAEKKSADIDVLEAQLKKLDFSTSDEGRRSVEFRTPSRSKPSHRSGTPDSVTSSVFYTPDSKVETSAKSTRSAGGSKILISMVSGDDRDRWQTRARRKRDIANALKAVLEDKQKTATSSA